MLLALPGELALFLGRKRSPLLWQSGQHRFHSCRCDAIQKEHKKKIKSSISRILAIAGKEIEL